MRAPTLSAFDLADCSSDEPNSKLAWHPPVVGELTPDEALEQGLITADEARRMHDARASAGIGPNEALAGDHDEAATTDSTPQIGDNGPPPGPLDDPGPDREFKFTFPVPEHINTDAFVRALREQGPHPNRLGALDQAAWRVRADKKLSHACFRLYDGIVDMSRGPYRCLVADLETVCFITGFPGAKNAWRLLEDLDHASAIVALRYLDGELGDTRSRRFSSRPPSPPKTAARQRRNVSLRPSPRPERSAFRDTPRQNASAITRPRAQSSQSNLCSG
jgi:hypothetical protein